MSYRTLKLSLLISVAALTACAEDGPETMVGTLERDRIELKVESNEPIVSILVVDGQVVSEKAVVLEQDRSRHLARFDQQSAVLRQAGARLAELQRGPRKELIRESQARLSASEVITRNARQELDRAQDIFDRGLSNQSVLDRAQATWEASRASEQAKRESLASLLSGTTVEELQQAQALVDAADAQVRLIQIDIERSSIHAPVAGVIDKVLYEVGERPQPGATVAVLLDNSKSFARIYVPEHLKASVLVGTVLNISLDGVEAVQQGTVSWVSSDSTFTPYFALTERDRSRLSFLAEVEIMNAESFPAGLPLEAWLPTGTSQ
jgi:HlyD family secretion protein